MEKSISSIVYTILSRNALKSLDKAMISVGYGYSDMIKGRNLALAHLKDLQEMSYHIRILDRKQDELLGDCILNTKHNDFMRAKKKLIYISKDKENKEVAMK